MNLYLELEFENFVEPKLNSVLQPWLLRDKVTKY
jgi:hypothetical protein